ncbi:recombinase zinc beta ribbon domain-containing protein [Ruminococcus sp.]
METHEAIIDMETFQAVQAEKERRAKRFNKKPASRTTYPFSGLLLCDNCGKNYRRKVTATDPVWIYGTFNTLGKSACASKQIPETMLQQVTADVLG